ncbi:MAG: FlgD immunoglobulin-like domain containing protein [bacterium]
MKRIIQLSVLILCLSATLAWAVDKPGNELQRKSEWSEPGYVPGLTSSYPMPFSEFNQQLPANIKTAAVSTGYYFYDNLQNPLDANKIKDIWLPKTATLDTTYQQKYWTRIQPGPRILDSTFWVNNRYGKHYFRNPADQLAGSLFKKSREDMDSTRNAIAGPMPIGIRSGFYFNGLRYDSFYVSSNGVIGLTNRRYIYNAKGEKAIPDGAQHCYDVNSMDWFVAGDWSKYPNATRARVSNMQGSASDGTKDLIKDDFGYKCAILGNDPVKYYAVPSDEPAFGKINGIRSDVPAATFTNLSQFADAGNAYSSTLCKPALIAPFWGNVLLSQYNSYTEKAEDYGKVYFKYNEPGDSLVVAFYNVSLYGTINEPPTSTTTYIIIPDARKQEFGYVEWDAKVILSGRDSSITFIYQRLRGQGKNGASCGDIIRANTISGLLGWARHTNYSTKNPDQAVTTKDGNYPWSNEYMQYTHYFARWIKDINQAPFSGTTVIFKQWPNVLRAVDIAYRVRNAATYQYPDMNYTQVIDDVSDYELLAGEPLIGAIQPVCVLQNLSNDIQGPQGVNFIPQDYEFKAQFRLTNTATGRIVYNKALPITKNCMSLDANWENCYNETGAKVRLVSPASGAISAGYYVNSTTVLTGAAFKTAGYTGVPPYSFVQVQYPDFEPNEFIDNQIGRLRGSIIAQTNIEGQDKWPFDDSLTTNLFVMKRMNEFTESASDYHRDIFTGFALPATNRWVSINADVVDGDKVSLNALPPRGNFDGLNSPTIRMNRTRSLPNGAQTDLGLVDKTVVTANGSTSSFRGDELRSFPIDLRGRYGAVLSLSVQRGDYDRTKMDRFWAESKMYGPEGKAFVNGLPYTAYAPGTYANQPYPDMLVIEFAKPSDDGVQGITNIAEGNWRHHPQRRKSLLATITNVPALTIFGSGGTMLGFLESDKDSALALPSSPSINALRPDFYDTGVDWDFGKYFVQIPDTFINWKSDGARNFRFRLRVLAKNNQINPARPSLADDYDDFFVDNIQLAIPDEVTDVEVSSVRINWPYTKIPASQATNVPVIVKMSNNTSLAAPVFNVKVQIYRDGDFDKETKHAKDGKKPIYCRTESVANLHGIHEIELEMPSWNARKCYDGKNNKYTFVAYIQFPGTDITPGNDTTYSTQEISFDDFYAYESNFKKDEETGIDYGINDVPTEVGLVGRGLNVPGSNAGDAIGTDQRAGYGGVQYNAYAGKIAMKFQVMNTDTIRGYQAMFSSMNSHPDLVEFSLLENQVINGVDVPSDVLVPGSYYEHERGFFNNVLYFDQYTNYVLDQPIELTTGKYWLILCQTALDGMNLGASASRSCVKVTNFSSAAPLGSTGSNLYIDRNLKVKQDDVYANNNLFAFLNGYYTTNWVPFTPHVGNIGYPHTTCAGTNVKDAGTTSSYFNGTWIPLLRPFFGPRSYGDGADEYQECPDDVPVTLTSFNGYSRNDGIELAWETSTEVNNYGFEIERREIGNTDWILAGFVSGSGNSAKHNYYSHLDRDVVAGTTYNYRLRQMDNDGSVSCSNSNIVTIKFENNGEMMLGQNSPNPFNNITNIKFTLSEKTSVKLEVLDIFGKVITVLENGTLNAGDHYSQFSAIGSDGNALPAGTYLYRLTANGEVKTAKMTLIK